MIIAGTGHRPRLCPCGYRDPHPWLNKLREDISYNLRLQNVDAVIGGCAIGFDTWLVQEALKLNIPVWSYVPFRGQGSKWPASSKKEYERILGESAKVKFISEEYSNEAFLKRDRAMVDDANKVYSLLNPLSTSGGTFYTVKYATQLNKEVLKLWRD